MLVAILTIIFFCVNATVLPPGYVIKQYTSTKQKISTAKIEQKVETANSFIFNETIWFKAPDSYRITVSKDSNTVTMLRTGDACFVYISNMVVDVSILCKKNSENFFYNMLLTSNRNFIKYLSMLGINAMEHNTSFERKEDKDTFIKPNGSNLLNYNRTPVYVIGLDDRTFDSISSSLSKSKDPSKELSEILINKGSQVWIDKKNFYLVKVLGSYKGASFEADFGLYLKDGNDVPFPRVLKISMNGQRILSYDLSTFETGVDIPEQLFALRATTQSSLSELNEEQKKLLDYLTEYR